MITKQVKAFKILLLLQKQAIRCHVLNLANLLKNDDNEFSMTLPTVLIDLDDAEIIKVAADVLLSAFTPSHFPLLGGYMQL